ncbi:MAG TPA: NAD-dependent epimerase/dehydratase family protein [Devosia sp.]|nr:NAD-dependent epimerase/dehydratase family protein [Devosia sp.]
MSSEKLFITGGSGYVGRNLIRHFVAKGWQVIALARTEAAADRVAALGAEPRSGDLLSADLASAMAGCSMLVHAAADTDHGYGTAAQAETNVAGTGNILSAARQAGIARCVYISTESVLLDGQPLVNATERHPFPKHPAGSYSRTKAEAERLALSCNSDGFSVVAIRPRFVWGRDDTTALPHLLSAVKSGQFAWIDGGHYASSSTHIANLCAGVDLSLTGARGGEVYFITDGAPVEFRALITRLLATQGVDVPDKTVPRRLLRAMAVVGDILARWSRGRVKLPITMQEFATSAVEVTLDITKARTELGYRPVMTIEQGMAELSADG